MFVSNVQLHRNGDAMQKCKKEIIFWLDVCKKLKASREWLKFLGDNDWKFFALLQ